ncbi:MAG TPA: PDR/VanB family oxidoreductase [Beijerinckiaceae bacterium]|nr:PDR/VanB family oxidoreductase [Beijerinckiaceae bacterium]
MLEIGDASALVDASPTVPSIDVRLTAISYAARDTHLFEFRRLDGKSLPPTEAGAHIDVHLPNGLTRQYSLVHADDNPDAYIVGVKLDRAGRGGSLCLHEQVRVGQVLAVSPPRNNFPLAATARESVLIAGGIGITPIWCMIQTLERQARPWRLHYACRSRADAAFLAPLQAFGSRVKFHFDDENDGCFFDIENAVSTAPADAELYCCGPLPMLAAFETASASRAPDQVHVEYFTPKTAAATEGGFVVALARSHKEFLVPPGRSILSVLRDAGIDVTSSCEEGVCGACETSVIAGTPDHRDNILTEKERAANRSMMICCSGCTSERLVLDL